MLSFSVRMNIDGSINVDLRKIESNALEYDESIVMIRKDNKIYF